MNQTASLISPVYEPSRSENSCLRFAVHLHGADMGSLEVGQFPERNNSARRVLGQLAGSYRDAWQTFLVDLIPVTERFQLYLEARLGTSYLSDMAVDDVELLEGEECEEVRSSYSPPVSWSGERQPSPASCSARCGQNSSSDWLEGACHCHLQCEGQTCCQDFSLLCEIPQTSAQFWRNTVTWTAPLAALILSGCLLLLGIVIRIRTFRPTIEEGQEDVARIIEEEEEEDLGSKKMGDVEEFIDFTLAAACEVDIGNNTQKYETKFSLSNRKITSL